jgi:transposase
MFRLSADVQVYLHREPIDFRAGINSLAVLVQETMELDPFAPAVFAFCNRRHDRMKLLFFDRSGFVMVLKRLTEDRFRWPRRQETVVLLTTEQLHWILDGIDIDAMVRHPVRQYQVVG